MATLTGNISASQTVIPVSGAAPQTGSYFTVDSEAVKFLGTSRGPQGRSFLRDYWSVDRGVAGTTAATHSNGTALTQYYPDSAGGVGGSGVTVDNGTDPPASVTTLVAPGADVSTPGTADLSGAIQLRVFRHTIRWDDTVGGFGEQIIGEMAAGEVVIFGTLFITEAWVQDPVGETEVMYGVGATNAFNIVYDMADVGTSLLSPLSTSIAVATPYVIAESGDKLWAEVIPSNGIGALVSGEADIYAIIATPAA
jgi:hypothetical protein